jgi:hypothetical protein
MASSRRGDNSGDRVVHLGLEASQSLASYRIAALVVHGLICGENVISHEV